MLTIFSTKVFTKCAQIELGFLLGLVVAHHNFLRCHIMQIAIQ